jgi:hypothetical protein
MTDNITVSPLVNNVSVNSSSNAVTVSQTTANITIANTTQSLTVTNQQPNVGVTSVGAQGATGSPGVVPVFTRQNALSTVTGTSRFYFESTRIISQVRASVGTAPTGSSTVIDTLINGTSIGTTTIPAGSFTATTSTSQTVNSGDYATISILSVGSSYPGADLVVTLNIN